MTLDELEVIITANSKQLQKEMEKVKKAVQSVENSVKKSTSNSSKAFDKLADSVGKAGKAIKGFAAAFISLQALQTVFASIHEGVQAFATMEASAENIKRTLGSSSKDFFDWADNQAAAFGIAKVDAMSYGNTLSLLVASYEQETSTIAAITQNLLEATSVVASRSGRTIEDVLMRITSGMRGETEAIEDLGVFAQVSILAQTRAYQQYANGRHWDTLDERTKQQIRTAGILEQIMLRYGDTMAGGTMYSMLMFSAALKNLKTAWGEAFAPVYNFAIPALVTLMNAISKVLGYLAQFNKLLFGSFKGNPSKTENKGLKEALEKQDAVKTNQDGINKSLTTGAARSGALGSNMKKAADAAKKMKQALMGFDEINTLPSADSSTDLGGAGAGDIGSVDLPPMVEGVDDIIPDADPSPPKWMIELVKNIKELFRDIFNPWKEAWNKYKAEFKASTETLLSGVTEVLKSAWGTITSIFKSDAYTRVVDGLVNTFSKAFKFIVALLDSTVLPALKGFFDTLNPSKNPTMAKFLDSLGKLAETFAEVAGAIYTLVKPAFDWLKPKFEWLGSFIADILIGTFQMFVDAIQGVLDFFMGIVEGDWKRAWDGFLAVVYNVFMLYIGKWALKGLQLLKMPFVSIGKWFGTKFDDIAKALGNIKGTITSHANKLWDLVCKPFRSVGNWFKRVWEEIVDTLWAIKTVLGQRATSLWEWVKSPFIATKEWFKKTWQELPDTLYAVTEAVKMRAKAIWEMVKGQFPKVREWFKSKWEDIQYALSDCFIGIRTVAGKVWDKVKEPFGSVYTWFKSSFDKISTALNSIRGTVGTYANNVWSAIKSPFNSVASWFKTVFNGVSTAVKTPLNSIITMVNNVITGLNKISFSIPDWVPVIGGKKYGINIPKVPKLARGGIVDRPTHFGNFIAGEAGKEVVMPLENNTEWITQLAEKVVTRMPLPTNQQSNDRPLEVVLQVGTSKLGRAVINSINEVQRQEGRILLNL